MAVDFLHHVLRGGVEAGEVADGEFGSRALSFFPSVDLAGGVEVGEAERVVELAHVGLVDACHGEAACAHALCPDEIAVDAVALFEFERGGGIGGDEDGVGRCGVGELRYGASDEMVAYEVPFIFLCHALEGDAEEVVVGLEYALCHGIALHMADAVDAAHGAHGAVVDADGIVVGALHGEEVGYLNMAAEAYHLVAYGMLKTHHHRDGDDHDGEADGHSCRGYMYGRAAHLAAVALVAIYAACYEI